MRLHNEEGKRAREEFATTVKSAFKQFSSDDGCMDRMQLRAYLDHMNEQAKKQGCKAREHTDEYHDMIWECVKGYKPGSERLTQGELMFIFTYVCPEATPGDRFEASSEKKAIQAAEEVKEKHEYRSELSNKDPRIEAESIRLIEIYRPLRAILQICGLEFDSAEDRSHFYLRKNNNGINLRDAFNNADQDCDGRLNRDEFEAFYSFLIQNRKRSQWIESEQEIPERFFNRYYKGCNEYEPST